MLTEIIFIHEIRNFISFTSFTLAWIKLVFLHFFSTKNVVVVKDFVELAAVYGNQAKNIEKQAKRVKVISFAYNYQKYCQLNAIVALNDTDDRAEKRAFENKKNHPGQVSYADRATTHCQGIGLAWTNHYPAKRSPMSGPTWFWLHYYFPPLSSYSTLSTHVPV